MTSTPILLVTSGPLCNSLSLKDYKKPFKIIPLEIEQPHFVVTLKSIALSGCKIRGMITDQ